MKKYLTIALFLAGAVTLAGCMGAGPRSPERWLLELDGSELPVVHQKPKWGVARVSQVSVCQPYDGRKLAVLRPDGTIAFDPFNEFAAAPAPLMVNFARNAVERSGLFERVIGNSSHAASEYSVEVIVTRLALDCRTKDNRLALCELTILLLQGRDVVSVSQATGTVSASIGNYTESFSTACSMAMARALEKL